MNKKKYKGILQLSLKTFFTEVSISLFVVGFFFLVLNFLNVIPRFPFISLPSLKSYWKLNTNVRYYGYDPENQRPVAMQFEANRNPHLKTTFFTLYFKTKIIDIEFKKATEMTTKGTIAYDMKLVTSTSPEPYYYKSIDFKKIQVINKKNNNKSYINLKDLKKGDSIEIYYTSDFATKKMEKLIIFKINNSADNKKVARLF